MYASAFGDDVSISRAAGIAQSPDQQCPAEGARGQDYAREGSRYGRFLDRFICFLLNIWRCAHTPPGNILVSHTSLYSRLRMYIVD